MVQVGFSTTNQFISKVVRFFTKAKISHCWFLFDVYGKKFVLQSDLGGVRITPYSSHTDWQNVEVVTLQQELDLAPAWDFLDAEYDYPGVFGAAWVIVGRWLHMKWKNPLNDPRAWFCSELITKTLQANNYPGAENLDPASTSPEDLYEFLAFQPKS